MITLIHIQEYLKVTLVSVCILSSSALNSQCDPTTIDPCEIGKNSIIQASYHAQIIKTSIGYSITGQDLAANGTRDQTVLTNVPSATYPMPTDVFPVWGAIGGRTQVVFLGSDSRIYAVGEEDLVINGSHTSNSTWGVTSLSLPTGVTACDINKWEGTCGSGNSSGNATGIEDGFLVFSTYDGELYITGNGASAIQAQASSVNWSKMDLPIGITAIDFAVGYRTLLVHGNDGNLYGSGPDTYIGNGSSPDLTTITQLAAQPSISINGITQIEAGFSAYYVLDGDGTIHVIGENSEATLGVGNDDDVTRWSKVGSGCSEGELTNVAYISTLSSHDYRSASSAILIDETIRSWGINNKSSITSGGDREIACPIRPAGTIANTIAMSNGGHITPYVNIDVQICNIGHNREGAFGDGNNNGQDYGEYICINIPGMPEICGTKKADLNLVKRVNTPTAIVDSTIVFTLLITNNGEDASTGSTVRDLLSSGFEYISDDSNGTYNSATGLWTVGPLDDGETKALNITVRVRSNGAYTNYAQVISDSEVDTDSTPGDSSIDQDDDDFLTVEVLPCPASAICQSLADVAIDDCKISIPDMYDAGNTEAEIEDIFDELNTCGVPEIFHVDEIPVDSCSSQMRTYSLTDDGFELISCTRRFTFVEDTEGPAVSCPDDVTITCGDELPVSQLANLEGTDNCSGATLFSITAISDESIPTDICETDDRSVERTYTVIDACGNTNTCSQSFSFQPQNIFIPNAFSPNGDELNKVWTVFNSSNVNITECRIYDRWGNIVYSTTEEQPRWNGRCNNKDCNQGVYIYIFSYQGTSGVSHLLSGNITLIR